MNSQGRGEERVIAFEEFQNEENKENCSEDALDLLKRLL
jgi:hypothetical protein